jgi:hypothetical protein
LTRARQRHPNRAEICHIVQHVVIMHRIWVTGGEFEFGSPAAAATAA